MPDTEPSDRQRYDLVLDELLESLDRDFVPAVEAEKLVARMLETSPGVLTEWLLANAAEFTTMALGARMRSGRAVLRRSSPIEAFRAAAEAHGGGDPDGLRALVGQHLEQRFTVSDDQTRRKVRHMTGADHRYVAEAYESSGRRALLLASFHRAVAKKVGRRTTEEVFTEEKYDQLYRSITRQAA